MKPKYSKKVVDEICKYIGAGNTAKDACLMCDISEETFYNWQRPEVKDKKTGEMIKNPQFHPELSELLKKAEAKFKATHISIINRAASGTKGLIKTVKQNGDIEEKEVWLEKPNWFASAWVLERKFKKEYAVRREITGEDDKPIEVLHIYKPEKKKEGEA
ncbi:MAG: hypothetical protein PHC29_08430 [Candidatus Omnitrophica bacterium]|nr:hypothetical protein [Candidatus Omnitrophota bacterium]